LPIPPQELSISMPVADTVIPTLTGYNEISGGAPFRNIMIAGTTGLWPDRVAVSESGEPNPLTTAVAPITDAVTELVTGAPPRITNAASKSTFPLDETGFFRFHQLRQFLEGYVALKRRADPVQQGDEDKAGQRHRGQAMYPERLRLALAIWRDSTVYLCRLQQFDMRRSADRPLEYRYSIQLQAFKRVDINERGQAKSELKINTNRINRLFDVMNRINAVRKILSGSQKLIQFGVLGPLSIINELSRQVSGAVKDVLGITRSLIDMPSTFARSIVGSLLEASQQIASGVADITDSVNSYNSLPEQLRAQLAAAASQLGLGATTDNGARTRMTLQGVAAQSLTTSPGTPTQGIGYVQASFVDTDKEGKPGINATGIDPDDVLDAAPDLGDLGVNALSLTTP